MPDIYLCEIIENTLLIDNIYSITIRSRELAQEAVAGQFLHIKCGEARLLRRPISICYVEDDKVNLVYETKGEGTMWLSRRAPGQKLDILGPLGNGFCMPDGNLIVVGGGVGTPPMLFAAQSAKKTVTAVLGFREAKRVILTDEFERVCENVYITTDDGSVGIHGTVTKPLEELLKSGKYSAVMTCGQNIMQKAVAGLCEKYNVPLQVSLEERMGCGIGACLVCACAIKNDKNVDVDKTAGITNDGIEMKRACVDGPVFNAHDVVW
ncbi:MAG: dihydroorotate dehydrogenase electron transfer subunit [Oscillospiraceae bacterium]|nr:dihydroorotate dehydrogenase electron transfer subunit [Oscillospiraceae bacterium]